MPKTKLTGPTYNLRFDPKLLAEWRRVMAAAESEGAFPANYRRTLSSDVNLALLAAVKMSRGDTPMMRGFTRDTFATISGMINGKVCELLRTICARLDLSLNVARHEDHLEIQIGDLDESCVLPIEHYRKSDRTPEEDQLARLHEFVGRSNN